MDRAPAKVRAHMRRLLARISVICALVFGIGVAPMPAEAAAPAGVAPLEKIAVVEVQRCILETREGKRAKKDLEKAFAKNQARLDRKGKALRKRYEDLQAKARVLSEEELMKRQQELVRGQQELQELGMKLQQEIAEKEALLTEKIYKKVAAIVEQIALQEKIQVVLVRTEMTVLYANPKLDLTNRVIVAYDKKYK